MDANYFAYHQYRDYRIYEELERTENNPEFKSVLKKLIEHELEDFEFWKNLALKKDFKISSFDLWKYRLMRRFLGLTFTARYLEHHEQDMISRYTEYAKTVDEDLRQKINQIIEHERLHESELISQIKEDKVEFMSSIILGLNDGLIELTGALVGFSFALQSATTVALVGTITGLAASLSMSASAYLQAQYEDGKDAYKAAFYTGIAYLIVVILLITPFIFLGNIYLSLVIMGVVVTLIISAVSFYTSVVFERNFWGQLRQMLLLSIGVAIITFTLGSVLKNITGLEI
jgi:VIT1/CCC1 family predicted Fe2+/Mn2+ transporter